MRSPKVLHIVLSLIAIAGFVLFIAACSPSWSPDGSQVAFEYLVPNTNQSGIALFDHASGKVTSIFNYFSEKKSSHPTMSAQWREDGRTVLVFVTDQSKSSEERAFIVEVAPNGDLLRRIALGGSDDLYFAPAAEVRGNLYLWGDHPLRVNLFDGNVTALENTDGAYIFRSVDQVLFLNKSEAENDKSRFMIGSFDTESLELHSYAEFKVPNRSESEFDGIIPPPTTNRAGTQIAFVAPRKDGTGVIVICDQRGLLRTAEPKLSSKYRIGNLQWSSDGNSLYAGILTFVKKNVAVWSIAEINAESGRITHMVPVTQLDADKGDVDDTFFYLFPIALSPDGHTVATNLAGAPDEAISDSDRALYLVDVSGGWNKVTKIPYPHPGTVVK